MSPRPSAFGNVSPGRHPSTPDISLSGHAQLQPQSPSAAFRMDAIRTRTAVRELRTEFQRMRDTVKQHTKAYADELGRVTVNLQARIKRDVTERRDREDSLRRELDGASRN